jgi:hypothetical protein
VRALIPPRPWLEAWNAPPVSIPRSLLPRAAPGARSPRGSVAFSHLPLLLAFPIRGAFSVFFPRVAHLLDLRFLFSKFSFAEIMVGGRIDADFVACKELRMLIRLFIRFP